nr:unnamed protein product [Callosobruchus chinensis]
MAFRMDYSFEGDSKTRPEQNLSGASKKITRDVLLQKTYEERRKRQEQRLKLQSAELLQSHIRSYLVRKHCKQEQRQHYDCIENSASISTVLSRLLFFYHPSEDKDRMLRMVNKFNNNHTEILNQTELDQSLMWLVKRFLAECLKSLMTYENISDKNALICVLNNFCNNPNTMEYLLKKGYYEYLRIHLEQAKEQALSEAIELIHRPFLYINRSSSLNDLALSQFCKHFLKSAVSPNLKILISHLRSKSDFPFNRILTYLNSCSFIEGCNSLLYCVLTLEPDSYEPNYDSVQVLAKLSMNLHDLKPPEHTENEDSDDENEMEQDWELSDYLVMFNKPDRVRKLLHFLHRNTTDQVLMSFTQLCHNLLLVYKDSMRKYLLLYRLGLSGKFINMLWKNISSNLFKQLEMKGASLNSWSECHTTLSVFCDMFTFFIETLTDRENLDLGDTFLQNDLYCMSKLLKKVAKDLIEVAFPMCRSSTITATPEVLHLYKSCLNCVRVLYNLDTRKHFCPAGFWTAEKIHVSPDLCRKDYLSRTILPFHGLVHDDNDENHLPPLSTIEQRSLAILKNMPFFITFNTRVMLLRDLCRYSVEEDDYQRIHTMFSNERVIVIRRTHLYEDAFKKISNRSDLKYRMRIQFINNVGLEEAGIDGGGIFKEFINEVLKTAFDPNRGFFLMTADNMLYPNPNVHLIVENFMEHFHFVGRLVGKAIFENILVDLPLAEFFLVKLLVDRASAHYLQSLDPVLYRNLLYLRDYNGDVSDLGLDFSIVNNDLGKTRIMELKPNGANIPVTNENCLEYIQRLADLKLNTQLKKQCQAFREGLNSVVPLTWLKMFSPKELQVIISGDNQEIDISDLSAHTVYGGEFTADHPTIILFWKVVHRFTDIQKKQLLKFVTSCSRPPLLGFKELNPQFCILSSGTENRMPTASTCLNLLKLPIIREEEVLRNKLLEAIEQQAGFELS